MRLQGYGILVAVIVVLLALASMALSRSDARAAKAEARAEVARQQLATRVLDEQRKETERLKSELSRSKFEVAQKDEQLTKIKRRRVEAEAGVDTAAPCETQLPQVMIVNQVLREENEQLDGIRLALFASLSYCEKTIESCEIERNEARKQLKETQAQNIKLIRKPRSGFFKRHLRHGAGVAVTPNGFAPVYAIIWSF